MDYIIHNEKSVQSEQLRDRVREIVRKQIGRMHRIGDTYSKPVVADIYINRTDQTNYSVSVVLNLKGEMIYLKEKGPSIEASLHTLFDKLKLTLSKKIQKERKEHLYKRKDRQYRAFIQNVEGLRDLKEEKTRNAFRKILRIISGDVAGYIRRRLLSAEMTTAVRRGRFKIQELLDELFIRAYEKIDQVPEDEQKMNAWLYRLADEVLGETFRELEFERNNFDDLEKIVEHEYSSLEENFTIDGDEEIIPVEELDEYDRGIDWYSAVDLISGDTEASLLDEVTLHLNLEDIHRFIEKELAKLPLFKRTIMDLYLINQMDVEEIAEVKGMTPDEIEAVISETSRDLKQKLSFLAES